MVKPKKFETGLQFKSIINLQKSLMLHIKNNFVGKC